jgi:ABC-2 type transport system ATP-binding protein
VAPTAGTARLAGFDVARQALAARGASSVVFQEAVVDSTLTGRSSLELHARLWGVARAKGDARIAELVDALGLSKLVDRPVGTYSGGERRRLEIARALVSEPRVLFLDEPTVGLDPRIRHELLDVIAGLRERSDMTILLTTHYLDEAQRLCDRVAIMNQGEIAALDAPAQLLAGLGGEILEMRLDGDAAAALATLRAHGIATADVFTVGSTVTLPLRRTSAAETIAAIHATDVRASGITTRVPTLDDVYLRLTGNRMAEAA